LLSFIAGFSHKGNEYVGLELRVWLEAMQSIVV
jgi:hypothetical protein